MKRPRTDPLVAPFTIVVDGQEKHPWRFTGLRQEVIVATEWRHLKTGDYSIAGFEHAIAIERKSLQDLFGTLGGGRDRFRAEHERLAAMDRAAIVVEADWSDVTDFPPERSKLNPLSVQGTANAWFARFGVPWFFRSTRLDAEQCAFDILRFYWEKTHDDA